LSLGDYRGHALLLLYGRGRVRFAGGGSLVENTCGAITGISDGYRLVCLALDF